MSFSSKRALIAPSWAHQTLDLMKAGAHDDVPLSHVRLHVQWHQHEIGQLGGRILAGHRLEFDRVRMAVPQAQRIRAVRGARWHGDAERLADFARARGVPGDAAKLTQIARVLVPKQLVLPMLAGVLFDEIERGRQKAILEPRRGAGRRVRDIHFLQREHIHAGHFDVLGDGELVARIVVIPA